MTDLTKVHQVQRSGAEALRISGVENPGLDARFLLAAALGVDSAGLIALGSETVSQQTRELFFTMIEERKNGKPVHRILGYREFFGRRFEIGEHVLEPRPETELLVERILADHPSNTNPRFLEIGVGSGAIIVTLLSELVSGCGVGTDISPLALEDARRNAIAHNVNDRAVFVETDCMNGIEGKFDFIVSNPPYIPSADIGSLSIEVQQHDPVTALDGGEDGLRFYRRIFSEAKDYLSSVGKLYLETGHGQHNDIELIARKNGWGIVSAHLDLSGKERIVVASRK